MPTHEIGTREEWKAAREELAKLEAEHAELDRKVVERRRQLPWVPVEKEYEFDTEDGKKTLAELFEGRSQLLAYNIMYGPDYELGACPGCSNLGDELDGHERAPEPPRRHAALLLTRADRSPARLQATDGLAVSLRLDIWHGVPVRLRSRPHAGAGREIPEIQQMVDSPPEWLAEWGKQVGAKLEDGLREGPSWIAFARENGSVYHTYTVQAPDPFVAPYHSFLLKRTPKEKPPSRAPGARTNTRAESFTAARPPCERSALSTIAKRNAAGADFTPAAFVAVIVSVYVPGLSALEDETRPWKRTC